VLQCCRATAGKGVENWSTGKERKPAEIVERKVTMSANRGRDLAFNKFDSNESAFDFTRNLHDNCKNNFNNRTTDMRVKQRKLPLSAVIETVRPESSPDDWEVADSVNNIEMVAKEMMVNGEFDTSATKSLTQPGFSELLVRLHQCLRRSQDIVLGGRRIMLPADMLHKITGEVVRMAESEPYGIKGVLINVHLEQADAKQRDKTVTLGKVESTSYVAATFIVNITLKEDASRWNTFKDLVLGSLLGRKELYLSQGYKIEKQKLYRSNDFR